MLGLIIVGVIAVIGLILLGVLALFAVPFFILALPLALVGALLWTGIRWIAGLVWGIVLGAASLLQTLWHALF